MDNPIESLSVGLAKAVEAAAPSVLRLPGRHRGGASATAWTSDRALAAHHTLPHEDRVSVVDATGERREAEIVGRDAATDLALLKVDGGGLTPLTFGPTDGLAVGHIVVGLGRPGRAIRASMRMVGVLAEDVSTGMGGRLERYVETDRAIPYGFRGGPLVDGRGQGVGIQTPGVIRGADLAVPTETLRRVVGELESHGRVRKGFLGIHVRSVRLPKEARETVERRRGALVLGVAPDSAAAAAGLLLGDVILDVGGAPVRGPRSLAQALSARFETETEIRRLRAGQLETVAATPSVRD